MALVVMAMTNPLQVCLECIRTKLHFQTTVSEAYSFTLQNEEPLKIHIFIFLWRKLWREVRPRNGESVVKSYGILMRKPNEIGDFYGFSTFLWRVYGSIFTGKIYGSSILWNAYGSRVIMNPEPPPTAIQKHAIVVYQYSTTLHITLL